MRFQSIKFEISFLHTAVLGIILVIYSSVFYFISNAFFRKIDQQLIAKVKAVDASISAYKAAMGEGPDVLAKAVQKTFDMKNEGFFAGDLKKVSRDWLKQAQTLNVFKDYINFYNKNSRESITSANFDKALLGVFVEDIYFKKDLPYRFKTLKIKKKYYRVITAPSSMTPAGEYYIQIGSPQDPVMERLRNILYSMVVILPLVLILTSYVGRRQAARILAPVHQITHLANTITSQDLSARITAKHFDKEMGSLVESFNDMIARLEKSFKHIEDFSHSVAHELKTPLTIIKGEADLLLRKERSKEEYQQALKIVLEESERVLKTVEDLLLLAKLDYQPEVFKFEDVDLIEFLEEICEQSRILGKKRSVSIHLNTQTITSSLRVKADKLHLRRLFFNLIDNAVKFSPEGGSIDVAVFIDEGKIVTSITDRGPGIAQEDLARIFEKFYRLDSNTPGNGLGLNIAGSIARVHKGEILVNSSPGAGSTFSVILPA